jgi:hypothetical protein
MNPVEYAEKQLDVHGPWKEAQRREEAHGVALQKIATIKSRVRELKGLLTDREHELRSEAPSVPDFPTAIQAKRDFVKLMIESDTTCTSLVTHLAECQSMLEDAQADVKYHELGVTVLSARLTELGGLLHFYAAAKEAQTAKQHVRTYEENQI